MTFVKKQAPQKRDNAARMVVYGEGDRVADQKLDMSYLDNVVETTPEGTSGLIRAVEVSDDMFPAIPEDGAVVPPAPPAQPETQGQPEQAAQPQPDDDIDDPKFKGKSKKEVYNSLKELETRLGKQGNELGDYRKFFDQFMLKQATASQQAPQHVQAPSVARTGDDEAELLDMMLSKPKDFVNHVKRSLYGELQTMGTAQVIAQMDQQNADLFQDEALGPWLRENVDATTLQLADANPKVRQFIFNSYRSMTGKNQPAQATTSIDANGASPQPMTNRKVSVSPGAAGSSNASKPGAKVWTRAEVRDLYSNNNAEYRRLASEIERAYAEGRVINEKT